MRIERVADNLPQLVRKRHRIVSTDVHNKRTGRFVTAGNGHEQFHALLTFPARHEAHQREPRIVGGQHSSAVSVTSSRFIDIIPFQSSASVSGREIAAAVTIPQLAVRRR
jgi:hypothetical protein